VWKRRLNRKPCRDTQDLQSRVFMLAGARADCPEFALKVDCRNQERGGTCGEREPAVLILTDFEYLPARVLPNSLI
jgi:hypothetical protein